MEKINYLDEAATTRVFDEEFDLMKIFNDKNFYNPSASYMPAILVKKEFENARHEIESALGAANGKLLFLSSATESNNMVFEGLHLRAGQEVLISKGEHPSVFESAHRLEKKGIIVHEIPLKPTGEVDEAEYKKLLTPQVALVSIIHVSNETGTKNDIKTLCAMAKQANKNIFFHSDGVQAFGKVKVNLKELGVDLYTISAHKIHAPRGIAGLWIKSGVLIDPLLVGGGQENGLRSSTENVSGALAFAYSAKKLVTELDENAKKVSSLKKRMLENLGSSELKNHFLVVEAEKSSPYILSVSFDGIKGEVLANALGAENIFISTGSACSSKKEGNRILQAMGFDKNRIVGSVRISFSAYSEYDIDFVSQKIIECVLRLRKNIK